MMQTLRKKAKFVLFIALAGFALLMFFNWGGLTSRKDERKTEIAKIDGAPITYSEYLRFVYSKEQENKGISRDEIWNMLIDEVMWSKLIREEKMLVTDEEIVAVIRNNPPREIYESEYMKDEEGKFDFNKYHELLRAPQSRTWLMEYEYNLRQEIPREKLRSLIAGFGWTSPHEDSTSLAKQTTKYDVAYLQLPLFDARSLVQVSDEEAEEYYREHKEDFASKEMKILKYVFFEKKASYYDTLEAKERIEDFIARIEDGEDFLEAAREASDDTSVVLTFEGKAGLKPYLMNVYEDLRNGEMSDIIEAPHGFEVIKRIRKGVIHKAKTNIDISQTTIGEIFDNIMSFKEATTENGFDSSAVEYDLQVRLTYPLSSDNVSFPVRNPKKLAEFLSTAGPEEIGGPFSSIGGYYLFALDSVIPENQPEFQEIAARVKAKMERDLLRDRVENHLDQIYDNLTTGKTMEEIASQDTLVSLSSRNDVSLQQIQTTMGFQFAGVVAALEPDQISEPLVVDWAGYIIRYDKKTSVPFDSTMLVQLQLKRQARLQALTVDIFTPKEIADNRNEFLVE